ncbi:hypothetical protein ACIBSV_12280 [Embleya sp. NPDC050154]|uniref:hypothetical protein n=1 Tax=Embleya sp. NPDC050154 TaxID=3363988 RepID=UPI00379DFFCA
MTAPSEPRTDYSRAESMRRLGPEAMADIARQVAAAPLPSPRVVAAIQALYDQIDASAARRREHDTADAAA